MVSISNAKKVNSLLRKELRIEISKFSNEGLKDIKLSDRAVSYDAIKVGQESNSAVNYTDIYIFRDNEGNIVSTVHNKIDNEKIQQTVKKYSSQKEDNICIGMEEDVDFIPIKRQTIRGYVKENDKVTKCFEEQRAISEDRKIMESLIREVYPGSDEIIKVAHFENGTNPKLIKNHYEKNKANDRYQYAPEAIRKVLIEKMLKEPTKYCGSYRLKESKVSDEELNEIGAHQYFLPFFSPDNKFIYRMSRQVEKEKEYVNGNLFILPFSQQSKRRGYCVPKKNGYIIAINRINNDGSTKTRRSLANAIGHEYGHADWEEKVLEYDVFGDMVDNSSKSEKEIEKIKKYKNVSKNYINPEDDLDKYKNNYTEIVARHEGRKTSDKYSQLEDVTEKHFPALASIYTKDPEAEINTTSCLLKELFNDMQYKDML